MKLLDEILNIRYSGEIVLNIYMIFDFGGYTRHVTDLFGSGQTLLA